MARRAVKNVKKRADSLAVKLLCITFARTSITMYNDNITAMATTTVRRPASFRLRTDLLERLKRNAMREHRTLNNYVESVLLDFVYDEPNEETKAAIEEAQSRRVYPEGELYSSAAELFEALDAE